MTLTYEMGIKTVNEDENIYRIYDVEKTVCDVVLYRNKLGFETTVQVVKNYLKRSDRDINRLMSYAKKLHVETAMRSFIEILA